MKPKQSFSAKQFRVVLVVILIIIVASVAAGFYFVQKQLRDYASEISTTNSKAALSETNITTLKKVETYLKEHAASESQATKVVADSQKYQYQDQIIDDLRSIAAQSGITITSFTFSDSTTDAAAATTTAQAPAAAGGTADTTTTAPSGLKSKSVTIQIVSPVEYINLLDFINRIEQNTTKMQIAGVSMSKTEEGTKTQVSSDAFDIKVYVR